MSTTAAQIASSPRIRSLRRGVIAVALAAIVLLVAACGGSGSGAVAHVGTSATAYVTAPPAGGGGGGSPSSAQTGRLIKFAQCMRSHGVPDFPDPTNGHLLLRAGPGSDLNPGSPAMQAAQQACKSLAPSGLQPPGGAASAQLQAKALGFAACMRSHGVPSFPDPKFHGGNLQIQLGHGADPNSPQFQRAQQACRSLSPISGGAP